MTIEYVRSTPWFDEPVGRAVVLPGIGYTIDHPLLWWTSRLLAEAGWNVISVRWTVDDEAKSAPADFAANVAQRAFDEAGPAPRSLVVAKSFATYASVWAASNDIPGIWLTPLLTKPAVVEALTKTAVQGLLVGGTVDEVWDSANAEASGLTIAEFDGADHSLYIDGDWKRSNDVLREALEATSDFAQKLAANS